MGEDGGDEGKEREGGGLEGSHDWEGGGEEGAVLVGLKPEIERESDNIQLISKSKMILTTTDVPI